MKDQKIWIISEVFYPDDTSTAYIMTKIAEHLSSYGNVHVLCGPENRRDSANTHFGLNKVTLHRLKGFNFDKNNIFFRIIRLGLISCGMFFFGLVKIKKRDKVLLVTNPAFSIPLFSMLKRIRKFKFFILVHDVFPENMIPANLISSKNGVLYRFLKRIFDFSYKQTDSLFVLGRDMKEIMLAKVGEKKKVKVIENWADVDGVKPERFQDNEIIRAHHLQDKIVFLFAGNLGRVQGLEYFFELISSLNNGLLHFLFVGNGAMMPQLIQFVKNRKLKNVSFLGSFPRAQQRTFLNASHFGVVTLEEEVYGLGVPSKSYNILAAAKPIFFIGNQSSEIALMIKESGCGVTFSTHEREETIRFFNQLSFENIAEYMKKGKVGRTLVEQQYAMESILKKFKKEVIDAG